MEAPSTPPRCGPPVLQSGHVKAKRRRPRAVATASRSNPSVRRGPGFNLAPRLVRRDDRAGRNQTFEQGDTEPTGEVVVAGPRLDEWARPQRGARWGATCGSGECLDKMRHGEVRNLVHHLTALPCAAHQVPLAQHLEVV